MNLGKKISLVFIFCLIISFFCVSLLGKKVNSILLNYLNLEVERVTSNVIHSTVNDILAEGLTQELFIVSKNTLDEIEMIDYNSKEVNMLLSDINQQVYSKLKKLEEGDVKEFDLSSSLLGNGFQSVKNGIVCEIPLGSLTGNGFLNNLGPVVPIKMSFLGQVSSHLRTKVTSYGINNLYLEVFVDIDVKERISLPKSSNDVSFHIEAPLSIKIISGSVPDYYGGIVGKNSETVFFEEKQ